VTAWVTAGGGRQGRDSGGMATTQRDANQSAGNGDEQGAHKEVGGQHEGNAGVAESAKIEQGDDDENAEADADGVRLQGRNGGDQRAHSGGDTYRGGEDVVGEEGGSGEQAGKNAKVETGDGVGAAAHRICRDGLEIGKVNDDQQGDDRGANGNDVVQAQETERDQQAECGFGAISRGTQGVQTEDGNALGRSNLLGAFVAGGQGLANQKVKDVHESTIPGKLFLAHPFATSGVTKSTQIAEHAGWSYGFRGDRIPALRGAKISMRRLFLAVAFLIFLYQPPAVAQQEPDFSKVQIKVTRVSGNIYMLEGEGGNIAASVGEDGIVIVDDQLAPLADKIQAYSLFVLSEYTTSNGHHPSIPCCGQSRLGRHLPCIGVQASGRHTSRSSLIEFPWC